MNYLQTQKYYITQKLCNSYWVCVIVLAASATSLLAQKSAYTAGTSFSTPYLGHNLAASQTIGDSTLINRFFLVGVNEGCATVKVSGLSYSQSVYVPKDSVVVVDIPLPPLTAPEIEVNDAIRITTTSPMLVIQGNTSQKGGGVITGSNPAAYYQVSIASVLIPDHVLAHSSYRLPFSSYEGVWNYQYFGFKGDLIYKICSSEDNNLIRIISENGTGFSGAGVIQPKVPYDIVLDENETFRFKDVGMYTNKTRPNLTVSVTSIDDKVFKVCRLGNDMRAFTHSDPSAYVFEDMKLHTYADTLFYSPPIAGNSGNQYSIMALHDDTQLEFNGQFGLTLDSLQILDTLIAGPIEIHASNPILSYIASTPDRTTNSNWGSPFSVSLNSTNEFINESIFKTFDEPDIHNHYMLSIVTPTAGVSNLQIDGAPITASAFSPFTANPSMSWVNIEVSPGVHKVKSSSGFFAFHYTYYIHPDFPNQPTDYSFPSYGYTLGESVIVPEDSLKFKVGTTPSNLQPFGAFNTILCPGDPIYVQAGLQQNITWKYQFGDDTVLFQKIIDERSETIMHNFKFPGEYWLVVSDSAGCHPSDSVLIKVEDGLVADFDYQVENSCDGHLVSLQPDGKADSYMWTWPGGSSTETNPAFIYSGHPDDLLVSLTVTKNSCKDSSSKYLTIDSTSETYIIPNVFTPNGDGINDEFCIENVTGYSECFQLSIFNRWGAEVFSSSNPDQCWPADNIANGVYFYVLKIGTQEFKGDLTLSR